MRLRRIGQLTRRSADRALNRAGTSGIARVDQVLSAATAPASGFELNREAELVATFRFITAQNPVSARKVSFAQAALARLVAAKAAVAMTTVVLLGGGVAFAASTGNLPEVLGGDHRSPTGAAHSSQAPGQQETKGPNGPKASSGATGTPKGTPSPSLRGLCHAFQTAMATNPGKTLSNPAFTALATAAGGKASIASYCVTLLGAPGTQPGSEPTVEPTHPVHPTHPAHPNKTPRSKAPTPSSGQTSQ